MVNDRISALLSVKNSKIIKEQIGQITSLDGNFSQLGMWRVKSKLFPQKCDPPVAKRDESGNLITAAQPLKKLYLSTMYID
jgi:hypothetical protein